MPDRELILRSGRHLVRLQLSRDTQVVLCLALVAVSAWLLYATVALFDQISIRPGSENLSKQRMEAGLPLRLEGVPPHELENLVQPGARNWATARRTELLAQAARLDRLVDRQIDEKNRLSGDLHETRQALAELRESKIEIDRLYALLNDQLVERNDQLAQVKAAHRLLVEKVLDTSSEQIEQMEKLIASTGLNVSQLLPTGNTPVGQGGPFESARTSGSTKEDKEFDAASWEASKRLERFLELKRIFRSLPLASPVDQYRVTSRYGYRKDPINGMKAMHRGLDMGAYYRTPIYAPAPGVVRYAGRNGRFGRFVEIDHGKGIITRYGHLRRIFVKKGAKLSYRDRIGEVGNSGRSTGPHLHYEIHVNGKAVDPQQFLKAGKNVFKG